MPFATLFSDPIVYIIYLASLIICITIHECAHAFVADRLGDPTAKLAGRITLNPLAHLDPIGTLALIFFRFGWGKPVRFDPYNLRDPKRDSALIALAGPASNIALAIILSLFFRFAPISDIVGSFLLALIELNVVLAVFNFIPIHPLDGGKILLGVVPDDIAREWDQLLHQYGLFILILLILPIANGVSPLSLLIDPIVSFILKILVGT